MKATYLKRGDKISTAPRKQSPVSFPLQICIYATINFNEVIQSVESNVVKVAEIYEMPLNLWR